MNSAFLIILGGNVAGGGVLTCVSASDMAHSMALSGFPRLLEMVLRQCLAAYVRPAMQVRAAAARRQAMC